MRQSETSSGDHLLLLKCHLISKVFRKHLIKYNCMNSSVDGVSKSQELSGFEIWPNYASDDKLQIRIKQ